MATVSDQHVEEDTVEYFVFSALTDNASVVDQLEELRVECFSLLNDNSQSYIWHHDGINLVAIHEGKTARLHQKGLVNTSCSIPLTSTPELVCSTSISVHVTCAT